jgi:general stress protein YciG
MHHRKIYEQHHQCSLLPGIEIHHIDGNHNNNDPTNLLAVTIEEHLAIHNAQGDWGAVQAILMRMANSNEAIAEAARQKQLQLISEGNHNFQKMSKDRKQEVSRKAGLKTVQLGIGLHKINQDPVLASANGKRAGHLSQMKRRDPQYSYLNTLQGKAVKNTKWYYNTDTNEKVRATDKPDGLNWIEGMGPISSPKNKRPANSYEWWINTETGLRRRASHKPDGNGWIKGFKV